MPTIPMAVDNVPAMISSLLFSFSGISSVFSILSYKNTKK